jgi:hypothetical protein
MNQVKSRQSFPGGLGDLLAESGWPFSAHFEVGTRGFDPRVWNRDSNGETTRIAADDLESQWTHEK